MKPRCFASKPPLFWLAILSITLGLLHSALLQTSRGSDEEAQEKWQDLLTDPKLPGWVAEPKEQLEAKPPNWSIENGVLKCAGRGFGFLRYDTLLTDFEVKLEFRSPVGGNSGVGIRSGKYLGNFESRPSVAGYEIQILDDHGSAPTPGATCSLYRYVSPRVVATRPAGEWNQLAIKCRGPRIRIVLNDQVVQDLDQTTIEAIKDKPLAGYFMLQCHTNPVEFRNLQLRQLKLMKVEHTRTESSAVGTTGSASQEPAR